MHSRIPTPLLFEMNLAPDISPTPIAMFLPSRKVADKLITSALDDACALESFIHRPTFDRLLTRVYATNPLEFSSEERSFVPLLYAILALGCLFTPYYWGRMDYFSITMDEDGVAWAGFNQECPNGLPYPPEAPSNCGNATGAAQDSLWGMVGRLIHVRMNRKYDE